MRGTTILLLILAVLAACINDELCTGKGTNELKIRILEPGDPNETAKSVTFDSIGFSGVPLNYPDFADTTVSLIGLPVDPDTTRTLFVFFTPERTDSLEVSYKITSSFISVECGPELLFSNLDTIYHTFDSLIIAERIFNREIETNIKIFY